MKPTPNTDEFDMDRTVLLQYKAPVPFYMMNFARSIYAAKEGTPAITDHEIQLVMYGASYTMNRNLEKFNAQIRTCVDFKFMFVEFKTPQDLTHFILKFSDAEKL